MARPTANVANIGLDVTASAIAADQLSAELSEWADEVERRAAESGTSRVTEARVRALRRHSGQFARLARATEQDGDE